MSYKAVPVRDLMVHEFGSVEGSINNLDEGALKPFLPTNLSVEQLIQQVQQGDYALLHDFPVVPLLTKEKNEFGVNRWVLNPETEGLIEPEAQQAILARTQIQASPNAYSASNNGNLHPPAPMPPYTPPPPKPDYTDAPPERKYEYCFELSCSERTVQRHVGCCFALAQTKSEAKLRGWDALPTEHGFLLTTYAAFDEPKYLRAYIIALVLTVSPKTSVKLRKIGTKKADIGFILVMPTVQLGDRLGFPTHGYFYHFSNKTLIQEYKIVADGKGEFFATRSQGDFLYDDHWYHGYQTAMLVYWKLADQSVDNQYLVYLERKITLDELHNLSDDWLNENGVKLDIPSLLDAKQRPMKPQPKIPVKPQPLPATHIVKTDPKTGQRESFSVIAEQHGLTPLQLVTLNPEYYDNPSLLKVGDSLKVEEPKVEKPAPLARFPTEEPTTFNHPLNSWYPHSEPYLAGSNVMAIKSTHYVDKDIPLVNVKTVSNAKKASEYGSMAILAVPAKKAITVGEGTSTSGEILTELGAITGNALSQAGRWLVSSVVEPAFATTGAVLSLFVPSQLGDGTLDSYLANKKNVRLNPYVDEKGKTQVAGIAANDTQYKGQVKEVQAHRSGQNFVIDLDNGITLTWSPDGSTQVLSPETISTADNELDVENIWVKPVEDYEQEHGTVLYPEEDLDEYLVTFPADSGYPPLYLVFKEGPRYEPGVVTGEGQDISGIWLEKANEGLGAPIPAKIADKLRGQEFRNFDEFREAFWQEVSNIAELLDQFSRSNQRLILRGKAPFSLPKDQVGGRVRYEVHHIEEIQYGGEVYDVDNLCVVTPKRHINIHKGK